MSELPELPDLPFEQVLSYLSLEDRLKSRAISRAWKMRIDNFRVKRLCYSARRKCFINKKSRWIRDMFVENFISSKRFILFFSTFGRSILSNLKHLRLYGLALENKNRTKFAEILQSFGQLEELDLVEFEFCNFRYTKNTKSMDLALSLLMLRSIHLEDLTGIARLTLDAPRLQKVRIGKCIHLYLDLVHVESVERMAINRLDRIHVKTLKNLKQLYLRYDRFDTSPIDPTLLSGVEQLNEVHLNERGDAIEMLEQKRLYDRGDLKIYLYGLLLSGPEDPEISAGRFDKGLFVHWAENQSRLADEIPFLEELYYTIIESVAPEMAINVTNRLTDLHTVYVDYPIRDIERFQDFLKNFRQHHQITLLVRSTAGSVRPTA